MASVRASMDDDEMDGPVDGINITPLVDVLMVVLVMFILTATAQVAGTNISRHHRTQSRFAFELFDCSAAFTASLLRDSTFLFF